MFSSNCILFLLFLESVSNLRKFKKILNWSLLIEALKCA